MALFWRSPLRHRRCCLRRSVPRIRRTTVTVAAAVLAEASIPPSCILFIICLKSGRTLRSFGEQSFEEWKASAGQSPQEEPASPDEEPPVPPEVSASRALKNAREFTKEYASLICPSRTCRLRIPHGNNFCGRCGTPAVAVPLGIKREESRSRSPQRGTASTCPPGPEATVSRRLEITAGTTTLVSNASVAHVRFATEMVTPSRENLERQFEGTRLAAVSVGARSHKPWHATVTAFAKKL